MRVWIDDRHPMFRKGLAATLSGAGFSIHGESRCFRPSPATENVDVVVFDADRASLQRLAPLRDADIPLVAILRDSDETLVADLIEAGTTAVLPFHELTPRMLTNAVRAAVEGRITLTTDMLRSVLQQASQEARGPESGGLTDRELSVLELLASGESTRGIAEELAYSERTVKNLVHDLLVKLNCRNRAHAVATATRQGFI